jgi:hypothetical protein
MSRSSEEDIAQAVIKYLDTLPTKQDTIQNIILNVPKYIALTSEDKQPSPTRAGEELWEQQVRNIVSHKNSLGNAIYDGRLSNPSPAVLKKL